MGGCQLPFEIPSLWVPEFVDGGYFYMAGNVNIRLNFNQAMDIHHIPSPVTYVTAADGTPHNEQAFIWHTNGSCHYYITCPDPLLSLTVSFLPAPNYFIAANGLRVPFSGPFDIFKPMPDAVEY